MAKRSLVRSHMPPATYAMAMGINPVNFEGCSVRGYFEEANGCNSVWHRFGWQSIENTSREDLAIQMADAEKSIGKHLLGFNVAPEWVELDLAYPDNNSNAGMMNVHNRYKTIPLQQGKIIDGGRRAVQYIDTLPVVYTDEDGDGFKEVATISLGNEYDWSEVKIYHPGTNADPKWEIRPITEFDKVNYLAIFDAWLFADPEETSAFPTSSFQVVDITDGTSLISEVDVYLEYNDIHSPSVEFIWNKSSGDFTQDGYLEVVDSEAGVVRAVPAVFEEDTSCATARPSSFCYPSQPDRVKLYFYAGNISDEYKAGYTYNPLNSEFAESIRLLATARLDRDLCGCSNIITLGRSLREDMALVSPQGNFLAVADVIQECPFGTRRGEWLAYNRLKMYADKFYSVALV